MDIMNEITNMQVRLMRAALQCPQSASENMARVILETCGMICGVALARKAKDIGGAFATKDGVLSGMNAMERIAHAYIGSSFEEACRALNVKDPLKAPAGNPVDPVEFIDVVFDGPPGRTSGRFIEVENALSQSLKAGEWLQRKDGYWVLRIKPDVFGAIVPAVETAASESDMLVKLAQALSTFGLSLVQDANGLLDIKPRPNATLDPIVEETTRAWLSDPVEVEDEADGVLKLRAMLAAFALRISKAVTP